MRCVTAPGHDRGVALVAVLWFTVAIAGMAAAFAGLARGEAMRSRNMVDAIRARTILEAGLDRAALELMTPTVPSSPRGIELEWPFDGALIHITVTGQSGLVDLNTAGPAMIAALARELGADRDLAPRIADAVIDWRDENSLRRPKGAEDREYRSAGRAIGAADAPFGHAGELRELLPVDPTMYRRLRGLVTVATGRGAPDSNLAPETVRRAILGKDAFEDRGDGMLGSKGRADAESGSDPEASDSPDPEAVDSLYNRNLASEPRAAADDGEKAPSGFSDPAGLYAVRLDAILASGYRAHADAVIWWQETPTGRPFRVLDWDPSPWRDARAG